MIAADYTVSCRSGNFRLFLGVSVDHSAPVFIGMTGPSLPIFRPLVLVWLRSGEVVHLDLIKGCCRGAG